MKKYYIAQLTIISIFSMSWPLLVASENSAASQTMQTYNALHNNANTTQNISAPVSQTISQQERDANPTCYQILKGTAHTYKQDCCNPGAMCVDLINDFGSEAGDNFALNRFKHLHHDVIYCRKITCRACAAACCCTIFGTAVFTGSCGK